jgi:spore coat polysaccharide biosynthesis protein SpsF
MTAGKATGVIIQARMGSHRLPGKVLRPIAGKPMLAYLLESLSHCERICTPVVSTSVEREDDPIEAFCRAHGVACYRGERDNVALRFLGTLERYGFSTFVRLCGDSPLLDHHLVDRGLEVFASGRYDLVTNLLRRTFPKGQSIEVMDSDAYRRVYALMRTPEHFEHVTRYVYEGENAAGLRIMNLTAHEDLSRVSFAVDTQGDFDRVADLIGRMERPHWEYSWSELVADLCATAA